MPDLHTWHSNGKLLLTGEYLVMEGAKALAIPINKGQCLTVQRKKIKDFPILKWTARKADGLWFQAQYALPDLSVFQTSDSDLAAQLQNLLKACQRMSSGFLDGSESHKAETQLEFDSEFGFGSSSTLVSNLAYWAGIDPFSLQRDVLGGSGYDIACARSEKPLFYQLVNGKPVAEQLELNFSFTENLYFVYLGHKQRTEESIQVFRQKSHFSHGQMELISSIADALPGCDTLDEFEKLLEEHENILSSILDIIPVKQRLFRDHQGTVKSLGAWGGDFVLMTSRIPATDFKAYLNKKGFDTFFTWKELVFNK
jgi:mevalonate kinase